MTLSPRKNINKLLSIFKKKYDPEVGDTIYALIVWEDKFGSFMSFKIEPITIISLNDFGMINIEYYEKERKMYSKFYDSNKKLILNAKILLVEKT